MITYHCDRCKNTGTDEAFLSTPILVTFPDHGSSTTNTGAEFGLCQSCRQALVHWIQAGVPPKKVTRGSRS
jgi:hypothetical protein